MIPIPAPGQPLHAFGGQIDVRVEVDTGGGEGLGALWDEGLWDEHRWGSEDPDWVDMSAHVLDVSTHQGTERWGERVEAGTASVTVDNTTGIFTPESGVPDPWFRAFRPGRRLRIVTIPDPSTGIRVPLFTGRFDALAGNPDDAGHAITATLQIVDFMGDWASYNPFETTETGAQSTDERVHAALDRYGWPTDERDVQSGFHNITSSTLSGTTLEECQQAADAEGGIFFASKEGLATFKNRDWLSTDPRSVDVQGYVGYGEVPDGAQAAHAAEPLTSWELARIVNHAAYAREGGTAQEVTDPGSQNAFGIRSHKRTDLHNTSDGEVLTLAVRIVNAFKDLRPRLDEITIVAVADPDNEDRNRLLWDTRLGDRLAVLLQTPYGWFIEREVHVVAMDHQITVDDWVARFRLDDAQTIPLTYWILEDAELGILNETTRVM
jgi:hypothetical protein